MLELINTPPHKIVFLGPGCSLATAPVAEAAPYWQAVQVTCSRQRVKGGTHYGGLLRRHEAGTSPFECTAQDVCCGDSTKTSLTQNYLRNKNRRRKHTCLNLELSSMMCFYCSFQEQCTRCDVKNLSHITQEKLSPHHVSVYI